MKNVTEKIAAYIAKHSKWKTQLEILCNHIRESELEEDIKWGMPTYTLAGKNVIGIAAFQNHLGLWFHNGVFLADPHNILENAQEGKTKAMRHIKYLASDEIDLDILSPYILQAIQNQKDGKVIITKRAISKPQDLPEFMADALGKEATALLQELSTSKRNEYIEYITSAKRETTIVSRLEKIKPMIMAGKGLNDKYRK